MANPKNNVTTVENVLFLYYLRDNILILGLRDIMHAIVMRISSVKLVLWLVVNLNHLFSDGAAFNTQSRSSPTIYAIRTQNRRWIAFDNERDIAYLDGDLLLITEPALLMRCAWQLHAIYHVALIDICG